ncbi:hypothetical protein BRD18_04810 [Halobacteriales archaeon SW_7_71_33]|nr:MAG: hypothetical protein BRD18_04810 [Halobacteriales archaeon SW_7_71_33]
MTSENDRTTSDGGTRRGLLRAVAATTAGVLSVGAAGDATARTERPTGDPAAPVRSQSDGVRIGVERVHRFDAAASEMLTEHVYDLPNSLTDLEIASRGFDSASVSVRSTERLERVDATTLRWTGTGQPRLTTGLSVGGETLTDGDRGTYVGDGRVAFGYRILLDHSWLYDSDGPAVTGVDETVSYDGEGFVGTGVVYAGPHTRETQRVDGVDQSIAVPDAVESAVDVDGILDVLALGERRLQPRLGYDRTSVVVLPDDRAGSARFTGRTIVHDFLLFGRSARVDGVENTPAHEYNHTIYGVFGTGETYWLKEATAEYHGYLLSLHAGAGTFEAFLDAVRTEEYADAVLSEVGPEASGFADYEKGAHVLAALDGEIRRRSDGAATLADVLGTDEYDLSSYEQFRAAVADAAGDETVAAWVDQYVRTDALPTVPTDPERYALGGTAPPVGGLAARFDDGDGDVQFREVVQVISAYNDGDAALDFGTVVRVISAYNSGDGWDAVDA